MVSKNDVIAAVVTSMKPHFTRNAASDMMMSDVFSTHSNRSVVEAFREGEVKVTKFKGQTQFNVRGNGIEFVGVPSGESFVIKTVRTYVED